MATGAAFSTGAATGALLAMCLESSPDEAKRGDDWKLLCDNVVLMLLMFVILLMIMHVIMIRFMIVPLIVKVIVLVNLHMHAVVCALAG